MSSVSTPHLIRRGGVYYFRKAVPTALLDLFGTRELKYSLKTSDRQLANIRCRMFSNIFEQLVRGIERMSGINPEQVKQLVRDYFVQQWQKTNDDYWMIARDTVLDKIDEADNSVEKIAELREELASNQFSNYTHHVAQDIIKTAGLKINVGHDEFTEVCQGILRAHIQARTILIAKLKGMHESAYPADRLFSDLNDPGLPRIETDASTAPATINASELQNAINAYIERVTFEGMGAKGINEKKRTLSWLIELLDGPKRTLPSITPDDIRSVRHVIERLPKSFSIRDAYKGKPLKELAALGLPEAERVDNATAVKQFNAVGTFFKWTQEEGLLGDKASPALGITLRAIKGKGKKRKPFDEAQLQQIFSGPLYRGCASENRRNQTGKLILRDSYYWIPLVGLFSGMRLGEIVQLRVSDIRQNGEISYFCINKGEDDGSDDKRLKTDSSERQVPVHAFLLKAGFLEYVADAKKRNAAGRIFADIEPGKNGYYSHNFSKWFSRHLELIGAKTKRTSFHSLRHTFTDATRIAQLEDSTRKALLGHADQDVTQRYGSSPSAASLNAPLQKLNYPIDLQHIIEAQLSEKQKLS